MGNKVIIMIQDKIDFVIYWVDGGDKKWQAKRDQFLPDFSKQDAAVERYRDWDNLVYLFRGIEKYASWVNKVYFITDEQVPGWLNTEYPNLVLVDHKDFIPGEYLPVFNANPIEINLHRIRDLAERFVVFNDDFFITDYLKPTDFFKEGLPVDIFMEYPVMCGGESPVFPHILVNDFNVIGRHFERNDYKKRLRNKILSPRYGKYLFYNILQYFSPYPKFHGLLTPHFARPYLKSSFYELWEQEGEVLDLTCHHRFRDISDVNIYVFRIWNLMKGNFYPANIFKMGKAYFLSGNKPEVYNAIETHQYKLICLNDSCAEEIFPIVSRQIKHSFEKIFPQKSCFEK